MAALRENEIGSHDDKNIPFRTAALAAFYSRNNAVIYGSDDLGKIIGGIFVIAIEHNIGLGDIGAGVIANGGHIQIVIQNYCL